MNVQIEIKLAAKDSYKRLLEPAISNEVLQEAKLRADTKAIEVFAEKSASATTSPLGEKEF